MNEFIIQDLHYEVYSFLTVFEYTDIMPKELLDYDKFYKISNQNLIDIRDVAGEKNDYVELFKYLLLILNNKGILENEPSYGNNTIDSSILCDNWNIAEFLYTNGKRCSSIYGVEHLMINNKTELLQLDHENDHKYGNFKKTECLYAVARYGPYRSGIEQAYSEVENKIIDKKNILLFIENELHYEN